MKKLSLFINVLLIVVLLFLAVPGAASAQAEPVGNKIRVRNAWITYPENAPFYIAHGWIENSDEAAIGIFDFELEVDGVLVREDFKQFSAEPGDPDLLTRLWVFAFPEGMTGTHTFTGHWHAPCQYAFNYPGTCLSPNEKVENNTQTLTITFLP